MKTLHIFNILFYGAFKYVLLDIIIITRRKIMDIFAVLSMIAGLALFLYGMNEMGNGLEKISGGKLKSILERLTSSKFKGVLLGAGVTCIIQSSSATTVMVVGLVNSGIMKLSQAIGIIMGANIGTTITSWLLSLTGIQSDNVFIKLLKPTSFTPILALIGIIFIMFSKNEKKKDIGTIFLGFTVLMFGMNIMSDAVAPLADVPEFRNIMLAFSNPILGMIAGAVLTAIIQSSSASVGMLQALSLTGLVSYGAAIPIIMGQNIGTCITAILSSIGANKNAKRAAAVHLYFNLVGTFIFMIVFYGINLVVNFDFLGDSINAAGIAVIHTSFNLAATFILLPFSGLLEKMAIITIKDDKDEEVDEFQILDERFLETPAYAINIAFDVTNKMAALAREGFTKAIGLLENYDSDIAKEVKEIENRVDRYEDEIGRYLLQISGKDLTVKDSRLHTIILHWIGEYERISDLSVNVMQAAKEMNDKGISFSDSAANELKVLVRAVDDIVKSSLDVALSLDASKARKIEPLEDVIDSINKELNNRHIARLKYGLCTSELGFIFADITTSLERISDHCSNVALYVIQLATDDFDIHDYIDELKHKNKDEFYKEYKMVKSQYKLPEPEVTID